MADPEILRPSLPRRLLTSAGQWLGRHGPPALMTEVLTALLVGLGAGFGSIGFWWLIELVRGLSFDRGAEILWPLGAFYVILLPALGGLLVGPLVRWVPEARGSGIPEVMEAVALRGGRIRPLVLVVKWLAASICIGSGGSVGREGPIVQIGSAMGSNLGQLLGLSDDRIRTLVACGAAGGIAATFNAPVAGVIFSLEVILGEFAAAHFATVVISSVTSSVVARFYFGDAPAFAVPAYTLQSPWELLVYALLGLAAALVGVVFVWARYRVGDFFDDWQAPEWVKPACGGLGVGVIGYFLPQIFGVGYGSIETTLDNGFTLGILLLLIPAKILATSLTLGSGGSGGIFAPCLFLGAMLGGAFGTVAHRWLPELTAEPGAYALVGMAAVFSAAARAPIAAILTLFEMTGGYQIILPLMLSTVIATIVASRLEPDSIYMLKLVRRGTRLRLGRDVDLLQRVKVEDVMTSEVYPVPVSMSLEELGRHFQVHRRHAYPVLDEKGDLYGIVSRQDYEKAIGRAAEGEVLAADLASRSLITAQPQETIGTILSRMAPRDLSILPVVERDNPRRLLGVIRRADAIRAYDLAVLRRQESERRGDQSRVSAGTGARFVEVRVRTGSTAHGRSLSELRLPRGAVLVSVRRFGETIIPHGDTVFETGDHVTGFVQVEEESEFRECFAG